MSTNPTDSTPFTRYADALCAGRSPAPGDVAVLRTAHLGVALAREIGALMDSQLVPA